MGKRGEYHNSDGVPDEKGLPFLGEGNHDEKKKRLREGGGGEKNPKRHSFSQPGESSPS